jgi:hypothetical protein
LLNKYSIVDSNDPTLASKINYFVNVAKINKDEKYVEVLFIN